jgi:hypothetical protein
LRQQSKATGFPKMKTEMHFAASQSAAMICALFIWDFDFPLLRFNPPLAHRQSIPRVCRPQLRHRVGAWITKTRFSADREWLRTGDGFPESAAALSFQ